MPVSVRRGLGRLQRLVSAPPHRIVAKAWRLAGNRIRLLRERRSDEAIGSYEAVLRGEQWRSRIAISARDIPEDIHAALRLRGERLLRHEFNLLGSGPVQVGYGVVCSGFIGQIFPAGAAVVADDGGEWLATHVNRANLSAAQALWQRIDDRGYNPIDWQLDFRSGYRWCGERHATELPVPVDIGADVKVPWELGRLQHFPTLALCAMLANSGASGFAPASVYAEEWRKQLYDFLALNPPRFGVQWMCAMDVGIRIANILLSFDLLNQAGVQMRSDTFDTVLATTRDHAKYLASHLEWAESRRGNHYLADLIGLLWASAYLPATPRFDAMLAFAVDELQREGDLQFMADGGNYENSTHYHCLSGEMLTYGVALIAGLTADEEKRISRVRRARFPGRPMWCAQTRRIAGTVSRDLLDKLDRAAHLARAATRPDNDLIQIGDTDSGFLFRVTPRSRDVASAGESATENMLDRREFICATDALFAESAASTLEAAIVRSLAKGKVFARSVPFELLDIDDLDAVIAEISALPSARCRKIAIPSRQVETSWERTAHPLFGLYTFRSGELFIAFRCAVKPLANAPRGHAHDDNLSVGYMLGDAVRTDPGSFCYTPSSEIRNLYRSAAAHDVVRAIEWDVVALGENMFDLQSTAFAGCLAWQADGVAGEIATDGRRLLRALKITPTALEIWDAVDALHKLRPIAQPLAMADGYGNLRAKSFRSGSI